MNTLDIIVITVIVLSALFAFVRGFVREALSIAAWIGAGAVTYYAYGALQPTMRRLIGAVWLADLATAFTLFVVSLLAFSFVVGLVSSKVRAAGLGALDRSLGLLFGLVRGAFLLCLGFIILKDVLPQEKDWPPWIVDASSHKYLAQGAATLEQLIPRQLVARGTSVIETGQSIVKGTGSTDLATPADPKPAAAPPKTAAPAAQPAYTPEQQRELNRAFDQVGGKE